MLVNCEDSYYAEVQLSLIFNGNMETVQTSPQFSTFFLNFYK